MECISFLIAAKALEPGHRQRFEYKEQEHRVSNPIEEWSQSPEVALEEKQLVSEPQDQVSAEMAIASAPTIEDTAVPSVMLDEETPVDASVS